MRSPYHLRVVEVRNTTDSRYVLTIVPAPDQPLGGATTFTGALAPGEVKTVYVYHGFTYEFRVLDPSRAHHEIAMTSVDVDRDTGLEFAGDSLSVDKTLHARLGEPTVTFSDSLMRAQGELQPDTTRGRAVDEVDPRARRARQEAEDREKRRKGDVP